MRKPFLDYQSYRFIFFIFGLVTFSILENFFFYRKREFPRVKRWPSHILIIFLSTASLRLIVPAGLGALCLYVENNGIGLFNMALFKELWSYSIEVMVSLVFLDLAIYGQHWLFHRVDILWKLHRVHHSDVDLDATSALRFHPIEILISLLIKVLLILIFGFSIESILIFEIILNFVSMFNHSNLYIPKKIEKILRVFLVTPQMHIIHHSTERFESDSNYGFNLSLWDRLFKTYTPAFKSSGKIGNHRFRKIKDQSFVELLKQPFI